MESIYECFENLAIYTPTKDDFIYVIKYMFSHDVYWCSGRKNISIRFWNNYNINTCINIDYFGLHYSDKSYYINIGYNIISVDEIDRYNNYYKYKEILEGFK